MSAVVAYFAYGSNMFTSRLRYRVGGCYPMGSAMLRSHRLCFHKRSKDGSGKCNALSTGNLDDVVYGVLFTIPKAELDGLHQAEGVGHGYDAQSIIVMVDGATSEALTYLASQGHIDDTLRPYTWYWDFVVGGAREHQLPGDYIERYIDSVAAIADPDTKREAAERAKILEMR